MVGCPVSGRDVGWYYQSMSTIGIIFSIAQVIINEERKIRSSFFLFVAFMNKCYLTGVAKHFNFNKD